MSKRFIVLATNCKFKHSEIQNQLSRYGIGVVQHKKEHETVETIYDQHKSKNLIGVFKEKTNLFKTGTRDEAKLEQLNLVTHESKLSGLVAKDGKITPYDDVCSTSGYINLKQKKDGHIFGWDDIFYPLCYHESYYELAKQGLKISSRDKVIAKYIKSHLHYSNQIQLKHHKFDLKPMEFDSTQIKNTISEIIESCPVLKEYKFDNAITQVLNNGVVIRSAKTRREKLYWFPLLNAGIPLTRKEKDPIHEIVYLIHDFCHFLIPDLIFSGVNPDPKLEAINKKIYLFYRMMSEAITIILADMLFVDGLIKSGREYKTINNRQIYPLFKDFDLKSSSFDDIEKILSASVQYTLTGNDSKFVKLIKTSDLTNLNKFKEKYEPFFTADYAWTEHNYDDMVTNSNTFYSWWNDVKCINKKFNLGLTNLDEFRTKLNLSGNDNAEIIEKIYNVIIATYIKPCFGAQQIKAKSETNQLTNAFSRYMMGQMFVFNKYKHMPNNDKFKNIITEYIMDREEFTAKDVSLVREFYDRFIDMCKDQDVMTEDDAINFKDVFPLFEPFIVSYEKSETTIKEIFERLETVENLKLH